MPKQKFVLEKKSQSYLKQSLIHTSMTISNLNYSLGILQDEIQVTKRFHVFHHCNYILMLDKIIDFWEEGKWKESIY